MNSLQSSCKISLNVITAAFLNKTYFNTFSMHGVFQQKYRILFIIDINHDEGIIIFTTLIMNFLTGYYEKVYWFLRHRLFSAAVIFSAGIYSANRSITRF